ncbi:MAG: class I SAM-dependent methyltransferase [Lachnospiraceae bacterium]|nr:class I SAM-dependent methyltransferase [Lachnospiraceae bacterium]
MEAYTGFASVYDTFMDNVPYEEWSSYLIGLLREYGVQEGLVCELGCGTGSITRRLRRAGYDMIGIDLSEDMLWIAREYEQNARLPDGDDMWDGDGSRGAAHTADGYKDIAQDAAMPVPPILYLNQDMREFELYGTVAAVVSLCDSMNYITSEEELVQVFRLVNNYLDPGGIFIFDMNTVHKYRDIIGDTTIAENREDCSFIWENAYQEQTGLNRYDITVFKRVELENAEYGEDGEGDVSEAGEAGEFTPLFERITETHLQRAYPTETVIRLLGEAGLEFVAAYEACTKQPVTEKTERAYFIAREKRQEGKLYLDDENAAERGRKSGTE